MIQISQRVQIAENEIEWQFIRSSGAGGQNVNKVATPLNLFLIFRLRHYGFYKQRCLKGMIILLLKAKIIKSQEMLPGKEQRTSIRATDRAYSKRFENTEKAYSDQTKPGSKREALE